MRIPQTSSFVALLLAAVTLGACGEGGPPPTPGAQAQGRKGDPPLVHQWQMPADKSVLQAADLGSEPPAMAEALMSGSGAPGISHRIATACAGEGALAKTASVALRWSVADGGTLGEIEGDPQGKAAECLAKAFRAELEKLESLPAGAALMVLRFHAPEPRAAQ